MNRKEISQGISNCMDKSEKLLNDAEILLNNKGNLTNILGLYTFALEEYGKGLLLQDIIKAHKTKFEVPSNLFGRGKGTKKAHEKKFTRALSEFPEDAVRFFPGIRIFHNINMENKVITVGPKGKKITVSPGITGIFEISDDDKSYDDSIEPDFDHDFVTDFSSRLRCFYVDWDDTNKCWRFSLKISSENLSHAINVLKQKIELNNVTNL